MTGLRQRADRLLVDRGLFESRAKAQAAIEAGLVTVDERTVVKPSEQISTDAKLHASAAHPWVSRGGVKLAAALDHFDFDPADRVCFDVGASTAGTPLRPWACQVSHSTGGVDQAAIRGGSRCHEKRRRSRCWLACGCLR